VVWPSAESVGTSILAAGLVLDVKVEGAELLPPAYLTSIKVFRRHEVREILVVGEASDRKAGSFEVSLPFAAGEHYSHELLVVDLVIELGVRKFLGHECNGMPSAFVLL
jgi:hypothetical protein